VRFELGLGWEDSLTRLRIIKELLERRRAEGGDSKPVEDLLAALEHSQKVFERDLAGLERRRG
jgi:hypothetical protein